MVRYSLEDGPPRRGHTTTLHPMMVIDNLEDYDLIQSFQAMDERKLGRLTSHEVYTILLGLGYLDRNNYNPSFTLSELKNQIRQWNIQSRTRPGLGRTPPPPHAHNNQNENDDGDDDTVTLEALLGIVKKVWQISHRDVVFFGCYIPWDHRTCVCSHTQSILFLSTS